MTCFFFFKIILADRKYFECGQERKVGDQLEASTVVWMIPNGMGAEEKERNE